MLPGLSLRPQVTVYNWIYVCSSCGAFVQVNEEEKACIVSLGGIEIGGWFLLVSL